MIVCIDVPLSFSNSNFLRILPTGIVQDVFQQRLNFVIKLFKNNNGYFSRKNSFFPSRPR